MKKILLASFVVVAAIIACKKTENPAPSGELTLNKYNLAGTYKVTDATFNDASIFGIDTFYSPCKRDDLLMFDTFNLYTYADSGIKCTPPGNKAPSTYGIKDPNILTYDGKSFIVQSITTSSVIISVDSSFKYLGNQMNGRFKLTLTKQP
jgi:hypothetical protein